MRPMTIEELQAKVQEAAQDGTNLIVDPLTIESLVDDAEEHAASIEWLGKMLGYKPGEEPGMLEMLGQVQDMIADFAALSAEVQSLPKGADPAHLIQWFYNLKDLAKKLSGRSVVLEIAEVNAHE